MTDSSNAADQSAAAGCDAARQLREASLPLPRGSEQSREEIARVIAPEAFAADHAAPEHHDWRESARDRADAILALFSTAHAEGLGKEDMASRAEVAVQGTTALDPERPRVAGDVDLRNAEAVCNFMASIKIAHAGPRADLEELRSHVANDVERLFDNASKVARTGFGAITAERCARISDAIRTAIVEIERYRAIPDEPRSSGVHSSQSEPQASAGKDTRDDLSLALERDEYAQRADMWQVERDRARAAETRQRELEEALRLARDLLLERTHGNPARSAGHNARLVIDAALLSPPTLGGDHER